MVKLVFLLNFLFVLISNSASIIETDRLWRKNEIRVCWKQEGMMDQFSDLQKARIQFRVQKEYTLASTGIHFVGWNLCTPLELLLSDATLSQKIISLEPQKTLGHSTIGQPPDLFGLGFELAKANVDLSVFKERKDPRTRIDLGQLSELIALHEFGHLAGLRHEHIREEVAHDFACQEIGSIDREYQQYTAHTKLVGPYDSVSVMNYCFIGSLIRLGFVFYYLDSDRKVDLTRLKGPIGRNLPYSRDTKVLTLRTQGDLTEYRVSLGLSSQEQALLRCTYLKNEKNNICQSLDLTKM